MHTVTFLEGLMRSLTEEQKSEIRNADKEYVNIEVSVFNAGAVIRTELADTPREIPEDEWKWNGYDITLTTADAIDLLDKYSL